MFRLTQGRKDLPKERLSCQLFLLVCHTCWAIQLSRLEKQDHTAWRSSWSLLYPYAVPSKMYIAISHWNSLSWEAAKLTCVVTENFIWDWSLSSALWIFDVYRHFALRPCCCTLDLIHMQSTDNPWLETQWEGERIDSLSLCSVHHQECLYSVVAISSQSLAENRSS